VVNSWRAALFELEKSGFDVALSDIVMPGDIDGLEFARSIRFRNPSLPALLASGCSSAVQEASQEFLSCGSLAIWTSSAERSAMP
jgi:CheY-like chemotaxis protein